MSEPKLISPMLDNFVMGDPISDHDGVRCCPAMDKDSDNKYIVKIISTPASPSQLDALLLTGAYSDKAAALAYFEELANGIVDEVQTLQKLSQLEGFIPFDSCQRVPMEDESGFDVYLLSPYKRSLESFFRKNSMTHLGALNLGLDLCSALAVCRRSGYLYVDLKPENIYLTAEQGYRIGDLGFLKLDSLKYASLPDRYRSRYTAPEITDALSSLNTTVDVYAVGLILYQAFNGGALPSTESGGPFPAPDYADYEMAEIILKACAPEPKDRWQDPVEMGQALVSYMQRNGAHDTPIVPTPVPEAPAAEGTDLVSEDTVSSEEAVTKPELPEESEAGSSEVTEEMPADSENSTDNEISESSIYTEDDFGNLTFLAGDTDDETLPGVDGEDMDYEQVSVEVSDILNQADELIAHPTPDPVVPPEPIDVPIPPPLPVEEEKSEEETEEAADAEDKAAETVQQTASEEDSIPTKDSEEESESEQPEEEDENDEPAAKPKRHWLRNTIIVALILALLAAGFYYYKNYYLQLIDSIELQGSETALTVFVNTEIDERLLTVVCSDTYGNQLRESVVDGKAVFTNLAPDSAYTVKVLIKGFHRLTGDTSTAYTTPVQTNIAQFNAVTGQEDGSVILRFTIEGPDVKQWKIRYASAGEEEKEITFSGHMVTLPGLTVGNEYTFELMPEDDLYVTGITKTTFTASKLILAENLVINSCTNGKLVTSWTAPEGAAVANWTVHCYNDKGYDETIVTEQTTATFEGITDTDSYNVEVTAAGMSVNQRAYVAENSITVTDFQVSSSANDKAVLSWGISGTAPQNGWILLYTADGSAAQEISVTTGNSIEVPPLAPGAKYKFTLQTASGGSVLGGILSYTTPAALNFSGYGVTKEYIDLNMCKTPSFEGWDRYDLSSSDYTTTFAVGGKASFLIRLRTEYDTAKDIIVTMYVIRDESGNIVSTATQSGTWSSMWYRNYGEFDIPTLPGTAGNYSISIYFNGALAGEQSFTMTN